MTKKLYCLSTKKAYENDRNIRNAIATGTHASTYAVGNLHYDVNEDGVTINFDHFGKCLDDDINRCSGSYTDNDGKQYTFWFDRVYTNEYELRLSGKQGTYKSWKYNTIRAKNMTETGLIRLLASQFSISIDRERALRKISLQFRLATMQANIEKVSQEISEL